MTAAAVQMLLLAGGLAATPVLAQATLAQSAPTAAVAPAQAEASDRLGLKDLAMMERVSDPRVSPDGRRVIYAVTRTDWDGNRNLTGLWMADVDGATAPRRLPISEGGVSGARWAGRRTGSRSTFCRRAGDRPRCGGRTARAWRRLR